MEYIKCLRDSSYGIGGGKFKDFKAGQVYAIGSEVSGDIASQLVSNRTAVVCDNPTKASIVSENKMMAPDENKVASKKGRKGGSK